MTFQRVQAVDYHTGGEPFRIVADPPVAIIGDSVAARRDYAMGSEEVDRLRRLLCHEPRGHADMYGCFLTPPDDDGAELGVLFWHKDGFSTACGHGTIALGVWAIQTGRLPVAASGVTEVPIDVPSGRVVARVHTWDGHDISAVDFINVASRVIDTDVEVGDDSRSNSRRHRVRRRDLCAGACQGTRVARCARCDRRTDRHRSLRSNVLSMNDRAASTGRRCTKSSVPTSDGNLHQRSVTIFADGAVDRSPVRIGHGGPARRARRSWRDSTTASCSFTTPSSDPSSRPASSSGSRSKEPTPVIPRITGMAYKTGDHVFDIDPRDPMVPGFVLR